MKLIKKGYHRISELCSIRNLFFVSVAVFVLSLLPICYLSFVNRATGDDYGYGTLTRAAWMSSHSLIEVAKAIRITIKEYYGGWQGTWFSIAVFALQPEVFSDKAYVIVVFLMLFLWIGSTMLLFHQVLRKEWALDGWSYLLITIVYLCISIQFVPSTKSSIFWFNGCAHYMLPFAMCQLLVWSLLRYLKEHQKRQLILITVIATLLGGSNYQAALFSLIVIAYAGAAGWFRKKDRRIFLLLIPVLLELIGLLISMKAPGNKIRGGAEFGFSLSKIVGTIGMCFIESWRLLISYLQEKPMVFIGLFALFLFLLEAFAGRIEGETGREQNNKKKIPNILFILALICFACAMQAPALYANVDVSGGVGNMNYMTLLLAMLGIIAKLAEVLTHKMMSRKISPRIHQKIVFPGLLLCLLFLALCRSNLKSSTSWVSMEYIRSGQAADYKQQMELQTMLLTDENARDVVVPLINDVQGPLMQMPVTDDPNAWTNTVTKGFYGKNSVVAAISEMD